ncbi:MAG: sigma-54 dependent transcriptional regulator [Mariprofundaceae bacterium]|nr:sigma-54 dependent transcriptional regulator [Mariprofundaceae bacterium]
MADILLVEDEANVREVLMLSLSSHGHDVIGCANPKEAEYELGMASFDVVLTDLRMNGEDAGLDVVRMVGQMQPDACVLLLTAYASAETAVTAMREGAFDYLTKPVSRAELGEAVERALASREVKKPVKDAEKELAHLEHHGILIGQSKVMDRIRDRLQRAAKRDFTVLITGESGTGKELAARFVHETSPRENQPFIPVHCGAIPESLFESELFGHVKGAFTGADHDKTGLIESADGGTLFLDEIGEMPLLIQVKLLRVLQDMKVRRVGGETEKQVNVRIVAATNRDLDAEVRAGNFREDLFYRLNVIPVHMPALRQRREDIPALITSLMKRCGGANVKISESCLHKLVTLPLAGNVRELENILQRLLALSDEEELDEHLLDENQWAKSDGVMSLQAMLDEELGIEQVLEGIEKRLIQEALFETKGNATQAAKLLRLSFRSIRYRISKLGIKEGDE